MSCYDEIVEWCEQLLFGATSVAPPPHKLKQLILRMEVEDIPWSHIITQGGFTAFSYYIHADLNYLIDYLEKQWIYQEPPHAPNFIKTQAVSKFWDQLQLLLARRDVKRVSTLPAPTYRDDEILQLLLEGNSAEDFQFQSANFWGEVARRFINLRRPEKVSALPPFSDDISKRVVQLYEITCRARGQEYDPFNMCLVPYHEHVNPAHYETDKNLESFMHDRPKHPLTLSVQALLKRTMHELLHGEKPSALLNPCPRLDSLLHNIQRIHESIPEVPHDNTPPKLIDIIQRLLALCYRDGLWEKEVPDIQPANSVLGTSLFYLTEQVRIVEREKRLLWHPQYVSEQPKHTCSDYLHASDKYKRLQG